MHVPGSHKVSAGSQTDMPKSRTENFDRFSRSVGFKERDTELDQATLSFVLQVRKTTHDLTVLSPDYNKPGDGWFDMEKNVDLSAHVLMSKQFSTDLRADRKNVVYLEDQDGQLDIPVIIRGQLPKPSILPDIQALAQRATSH
jgi:hypothetical protein